MSLLNNLKRVLKTEVIAAEVIVKVMPTGFFILREEGAPDRQMWNGILGLIGPVKSSFWCGGILYARERDAKGNLLPLPVFMKPRPVFQQQYGNFVHGDMRIVDSDQCSSFDGEFQYEPMR